LPAPISTNGETSTPKEEDDPSSPKEEYTPSPRDSSSEEERTPQAEFLNWMQHADIPVANITTDFQDGKNICKLVNLLQPGAIAPHQVTEDAFSTTSLAIDVATQLGVPRLVEAVDLVESPDALVNMAYFSFFWEKCVEQEEIKELEETIPEKDKENIIKEETIPEKDEENAIKEETIPEKDEENVTKMVEEKISGEIVEAFEKIIEEVEGKIAEIVQEYSEKVGEITPENSHLEDHGPEKVEEIILEQIQEKDKDKDTIPEKVDEQTSENVEEQIQDKVVESILEKSPTGSPEESPRNSKTIPRSASALDSALSKIEENTEKHFRKSEKSPKNAHKIPRSKTRDSKSSKSTENSPKHRPLEKSEKNTGTLPRKLEKSMKSDNVEQSENSKKGMCPQCRTPYQNSSNRTKSANPQERKEEELRQELEQLKEKLEKQNQHMLGQNVAIRNLEITLGKFQNMEINEKKLQKIVEKKDSELDEKDQIILTLQNKVTALKISEKGKEHEIQLEKQEKQEKQKEEQVRQKLELQKKEEAKNKKLARRRKREVKLQRIEKKKSDAFSCKNEKLRKSN